MKVIEILYDKNVRIVRDFLWSLASSDGTQQTFISDSVNDDLDERYLREKNDADICYLYE